MEFVGSIALILVFALPIGIAASCDKANAARTQNARYQCVKDGHTVAECKELFP